MRCRLVLAGLRPAARQAAARGPSDRLRPDFEMFGRAKPPNKLTLKM